MALVTAAAVSAAVILSAPFMGQIRAALLSAFPDRFVLIVGAAVGGALGLAVLAAFWQIRDRRLLRYTLIGAAFVLGGGYSLAFATGRSEVDVVERVHFIEYGLITFLFYRACKSRGDASMLVLPILAGLLVGTLEEWFQWFIPVRVGEARDVLLNLVAIGCGVLFSLGVDPPAAFSARLQHASSLTLGGALAVVVVVFAAFLHAVHLGHELRDPEIGIFKSRYTLAQLDAASRDRAERWRTNPPTTFRRVSREDQYIDEALWHVRRRNIAWSDRDYPTARGENRILEKYFAPMLDTPTYAGLEGHRWSAAHRAELEQLAGGANPAAFVSAAEPYPIVLWSRAAYWAAVALLVAVIGSAAVWVDRRVRQVPATTAAGTSYGE